MPSCFRGYNAEMDDILKLHRQLAYALEKHAPQVEIAPAERISLEMARQNSKRPAYLKLAVPDDLVKNLRGNPDHQDLVLLVRVPKAVLDREESPILLP